MDEKLAPNSVLSIARVCHEANRAHCANMGDYSQPEWAAAPDWQVASAIKGVELHLSGDHSPSASHDAWMKEKVDNGWIYSPIKDPISKTHPCIVPFHELPRAQQMKDYLFRAIVHSYKGF